MKKILFFVFAAMVASFTVNAQQPTVSLKSDPSKEAKKEVGWFLQVLFRLHVSLRDLGS